MKRPDVKPSERIAARRAPPDVVRYVTHRLTYADILAMRAQEPASVVTPMQPEEYATAADVPAWFTPVVAVLFILIAIVVAYDRINA